jgi:hypothetical protein
VTTNAPKPAEAAPPAKPDAGAPIATTPQAAAPHADTAPKPDAAKPA